MGKDQNLNAFSNTNEDRKYSKHGYQIVEGIIKKKKKREAPGCNNEQLPTMPQALSHMHMHV